MNRKSAKYEGVWQECKETCPVDRCRRHHWNFLVELPADTGGGRQQVKRRGFDSAKEAAEARADVVAKHRAGALPADRQKTFGMWLDEWIEAKVGRGEIRDSTERGYRDAIKNHLRPRLGHVKLAELRGVDLTRAYAAIQADREAERAAALAKLAELQADADRINSERAAKGRIRRVTARLPGGIPRSITAASIARIHAVVSGALGDAVPDLIPRSVAGDAKLPKVKRVKVRPPTPEQYGHLLDAIEGDRWYPLILLAGHSGLRRGELCGLRWCDVDLATGLIVLGPQRTSVGYQVVEREAKTEAGDERRVWLDAGTLRALRSWHAQQAVERLAWGEAYGRGGYIFTREDGTPLHPDLVTKTVKRVMLAHGLPATAKLHDLRHFRAAALISTGAEIAQVSKALGHKNIAVTVDLYGSLFDKAGQDLAARAADVVPRGVGRRSA